MSAILKSVFGFASNIMGGLYGYLISAGAGALLATMITWHFVHINNAVEISNLKEAVANQRAANVEASLNQLQSFIDTMHGATADYNRALASIDQRFAALSAEFKNAALTPLPIDCKPDANRVRSLYHAITDTNKGTGN